MNPSESSYSSDAARYALLLDWGTRIGLLALVLSFTVYLFGLVTPHVPLERLPSVWNQPVTGYLQLTNTPTGWGWLALLHRADISNLVGIALLASCSIPPLLAVMHLFLKQRNVVFLVICALQVSVLLLAASGVLSVGH